MTRESQHGFVIKWSYEANIVSFSDRKIIPVDKRNALGISCLDFTKGFNKIPPNIHIDKLFIVKLKWHHNKEGPQLADLPYLGSQH